VAESAAAPADRGGRLLELLDLGLRNQASLPPPTGWKEVAAKFAAGPQAAVADRLAVVFGDRDVLARMRGILADPARPAAERRRALELLRQAGDREALPIFVTLLGDPAFRRDAIPLVRGANDPAVATALLAAWPSLDDTDRRSAIETLASKPLFALPLVRAIASGTVDDAQVHAAQRRALRGLGDPEITRILDARWGRVNESPAALKARMAQIENRYAEAPHWAIDTKRGAEVFAKNCATCHMLDGQGGTLGQNLTGSGRNGVRYFIENVVDPNSVIGPQYQMSVVTTDDGTAINGIVTEETPAALVIRTLTDTLTVPKDRVEERALSPVSMMPTGLLDQLPDADVLALLHFLATKP